MPGMTMANLYSHISNLRQHYSRRLWRVHIVVAVTCVLIFAAVELQAQPSQDAGYILSISGNWKSTSSKDLLKQFQPLPNGAKITAVQPITKESLITIALLNNTTLRRRCKQGTCGSPIVISITSRAPVNPNPPVAAAPSAAAEATKTPEPSLTERVTAAFSSLFHSHATYFISAIVRKGNTPELKEAVLESRSGQVTLAPAFQDLPRARYRLVAKKLREDQPDVSTKSVSLNVNWNPEQPTLATVALDPGLYELITHNQLESWVLVTTSDQYSETSSSFGKAVELSKQWSSDEVDAASSRMFLRAFLASLGRSEKPLNQKR